MKKILKNALVVFAVAATLYFLWRQFYSNWAQVKDYEWNLNWAYLSVSILLVIFFYLTAHLRWRLILKYLGYTISIYSSLKYWIFAEVGRYVPGKIWFVLGRAYGGKKEGIRQSAILLSTVLELAVLTITSLIIFIIGIAAFMSDIELNWPVSILLLAVAVICGMIAIYPPLFSRIFNFALKKLKRETFEMSIPYSKMILLLGILMLMWIVHGSAFFFLSKAIYPVSWSLYPLFLAVFAISWFAGFVAFLTPGGLGIRELAITFILANYVPASIAVIMAIAFRLLLIIAEFLFGAVLFFTHRFCETEEKP